MPRVRVLGLILSLIFLVAVETAAQVISLSPPDVRWIGEKIFLNECDAEESCILSWNQGEEFLSLGMGHFIWYPEDYEGPFEESFPAFLEYLRTLGEEIPQWLYVKKEPKCPWRTREHFFSNPRDPRIDELYRFLKATKDKQVDFMIKRLTERIPLLLKSAPAPERPRVKENFYKVASTPAGIYALVDYMNFKGSGTYPLERYQGQGWGLLQVLSKMGASESPETALAEFSKAAERLLVQRVHYSPQERQEKKWLPGWRKRVRSYLTAQQEWQSLRQE